MWSRASSSFARREQIQGLRFVQRPAVLPHFTAVLARRDVGMPADDALVAACELAPAG
jgi:hypothetical protein